MAAPHSVPIEVRRQQYDAFLRRIFAPLSSASDDEDATPAPEPADDERGEQDAA